MAIVAPNYPLGDNNCYIYIHYKNNSEPFYVGKGSHKLTGNKYFRAYSNKNRNNYWHNIVNKYGYYVKIIDDNISEEQAFELEEFLINEIGRKDLGLGTLVNLTEGGEGLKNPSKKTRDLISESISKPIIQYSKKGIKLNIFNSLLDCSNKLNINKSSIGDCCRGLQKTAGNYIFRFIDDNFNKYDVVGRKKEIFQFDLNGNLLNIFNSITESSLILNLGISEICNCCNGKQLITGKFTFRYSKDDFNKFPINKINISKRVAQYSLLGELINEFESIKEASEKTNIHNTVINKCCNKKRKTAGKFIWEYV